MDEIVYSAQEVADILKIKKNTVYNMIKRGELVAYRIGNKVRVSNVELENYKRKSVSNAPLAQKKPASFEDSMIQTDQLQPSLLTKQGQMSKGFIICGQDAALDTLANHMQSYSKNPSAILRSYVGSYNSLYMLYQGQASAVAAHLWDGDSDSYNIPFVRHLLPGIPSVVIHLLKRTQGFYVKNGNPKNINSWEDLKRSDLTMVNREKGSGTRVLMDEKFRLAGINPSQIEGYGREGFSDLAVAGIVARGGADFAVGSMAGSKMVKGVDFIPLHQESYDLVIRQRDLDSPMFSLMLDIIRSPEYKMTLEEMDLYDLTGIGDVIAET